MYTLSKEQEDEINHLLRELNKATDCELIIYSVKSSARYNTILWMAPALVGVITAIMLTFISISDGTPDYGEIVGMICIQLGLMLGSFLIFKLSPKLRVGMTAPKKRKEYVVSAAKQVFMDRKIYEIKNRLGILIYASILEKHVIIQTDSGVQLKTSESDWAPIKNYLEDHSNDESMYEPLKITVQKVKDLLLKRGYRPGSDISKHVIQGM